MRNGTARAAAFAVSAVIHAAWFIQFGGTTGVRQAEHPVRNTVTRLSFSAPMPVTPPEHVKPKPKPKPKLKPKQKHKQKPKARPRPVKKKPRPRPVKKSVFKPRPEPVPELEETHESDVPVQAATTPTAVSSTQAIDEGLIVRDRQRYLAQIMARIEKHKWYPPAARRRGLEGNMRIRLFLSSDGSIRSIVVEGGHRLLRFATRRAVEEASPLPEPPLSIRETPDLLAFRFSMRYHLR